MGYHGIKEREAAVGLFLKSKINSRFNGVEVAQRNARVLPVFDTQTVVRVPQEYFWSRLEGGQSFALDGFHSDVRRCDRDGYPHCRVKNLLVEIAVVRKVRDGETKTRKLANFHGIERRSFLP